MDTIALYVGLDYHQSKVQVCAVDQGGRMIGNQACSPLSAIAVGRTGRRIPAEPPLAAPPLRAMRPLRKGEAGPAARRTSPPQSPSPWQRRDRYESPLLKQSW